MGLEHVFPHHRRRILSGVTLTIVAGALVLMAITPAWRPLMLFVLIPFLSVSQMITADRERSRRAADQAALARAEALAWATGDVGGFPPGSVPVSYTHLTLPTSDLV